MKGDMKDTGYKMNISMIAMSVLVFLFAPIEMYLMIKDDTWFSIADLAGYLAVIFALSVLILLAADYIMQRLSSKVWDKLVFLISSLALAFYVQGNIIKSDYGVLNGKAIDWSLYKADAFRSLAVFGVILIAAIVLIVKLDIKKIKRVENIISVCFILLMLETVVVASIQYGGFEKKPETICTTRGEWEYSKEENFVIIVPDSLDGRMLKSLLESDRSDEVRSELEDFVFCENTVSLYAMTDYSLLQILTGKEYLCEKGYDEFCDEAYSESYLLEELKKRDYDIGIYAANAIASDPGYAKNWYRVRYGVDSHLKLIKYMYKFVGFRYLPYHLKRFCWFYPDEMDTLKVVRYMDDYQNEVSEEPYDWANYIFNEELKSIHTTDSKKNFYLYHLKGTHPIRDYTRDFVHSDEEVDFEEVALGCIDMIGRYTDALKEQGVYDNTTILILADHGESLYKEEDNGYRNSPLLLFKGKNEHGDLTVDDSPCTFADLDRLYEKIFAGNVSNEDAINALSSDHRYTYDIIWADHPTIAHSSVGGFEKIDLDGDASDVNAYSATGQKHLLD